MHFSIRSLVFNGLLGLALALPLLGGQQRILIKGSDTLGTLLLPEFTRAWQASHPEVLFETAAEGSSTGLEALILSQTDIALSSRRARPNEFALARAKDVVLRPFIICEDGIALIVPVDSSLEALSMAQVRALFTGEIEDWADLGLPEADVELYTRSPTSGTYLDFQTIALGRRAYARSIKMLAGNEQIVDAVARDPAGIGYVGMAYARRDPRVKILPIGGILPTVETVHNHTYPISRPNFIYTDGEPTGAVREIVDFILSPEGQAIVREVGFVPLDQ